MFVMMIPQFVFALVLLLFSPSVTSSGRIAKRIRLSAHSGIIASMYVENPVHDTRSRVVLSLDFGGERGSFLYHPDSCPSFVDCPAFLAELDDTHSDDSSETDDDSSTSGVNIYTGMTVRGDWYWETNFDIRYESIGAKLNLADPPIIISRKDDEYGFLNVPVDDDSMFHRSPVRLHVGTSEWMFPASFHFTNGRTGAVVVMHCNAVFDPAVTVSRMNQKTIDLLAVAVSSKSRVRGKQGQFHMPTNSVRSPTLRVGDQVIVHADRLLHSTADRDTMFLNIVPDEELADGVISLGSDILDSWLGVVLDPSRDQLVLVQRRVRDLVSSPRDPISKVWQVPLMSGVPTTTTLSGGRYLLHFAFAAEGEKQFLLVEGAKTSNEVIGLLDVDSFHLTSPTAADEFRIVANGNPVMVSKLELTGSGLSVTLDRLRGKGDGRFGYAYMLYWSSMVALAIDDRTEPLGVIAVPPVGEWEEYEVQTERVPRRGLRDLSRFSGVSDLSDGVDDDEEIGEDVWEDEELENANTVKLWDDYDGQATVQDSLDGDHMREFANDKSTVHDDAIRAAKTQLVADTAVAVRTDRAWFNRAA